MKKPTLLPSESLPEGSVLDRHSVGRCVLEIDPNYFRPTEVELLIGNPDKIKQKIGWEPEYALQDLVSEMMQSDLKIMARDKALADMGHKVNKSFD